MSEVCKHAVHVWNRKLFFKSQHRDTAKFYLFLEFISASLSYFFVVVLFLNFLTR